MKHSSLFCGSCGRGMWRVSGIALSLATGIMITLQGVTSLKCLKCDREYVLDSATRPATLHPVRSAGSETAISTAREREWDSQFKKPKAEDFHDAVLSASDSLVDVSNLKLGHVPNDIVVANGQDAVPPSTDYSSRAE